MQDAVDSIVLFDGAGKPVTNTDILNEKNNPLDIYKKEEDAAIYVDIMTRKRCSPNAVQSGESKKRTMSTFPAPTQSSNSTTISNKCLRNMLQLGTRSTTAEDTAKDDNFKMPVPFDDWMKQNNMKLQKLKGN